MLAEAVPSFNLPPFQITQNRINFDLILHAAMKLSKDTALVYSTVHGRICPACQQPQKNCCCVQKKKAALIGSGAVRVRRETAGRGGKTVSTISGLPLSEDALRELLSALKKKCGSGGTLKDGVLEIQGDHVALLMAELTQRGYSTKRAGG